MASNSWLKDAQDAGQDPVRWAFLTGAHLLEAGRASLLLRDGSAPFLVAEAAIGIDPSVIPTIRVPIGTGIAGTSAERGALLFGTRQSTTFITAPIITDRGVEGVLNLTHRLRGKQYSDEHVAAATKLAAHIAQLLTYRRHAPVELMGELHNRQVFGEALERELARSKRAGSPFSVAMVELVNAQGAVEQLGSARFEEVICHVGDALRGEVRRYDTVSRYGTHIFAVLLAAPSDPQSGIDRRIAAVVDEGFKRVEFEIAISVGLAHCPADGMSSHDLLTGAQARLAGERAVQRVSHTG